MRSRAHRIWLSLVAVFVLLCAGTCHAGGGPRNVVLVINDASSVSQAVGAYYQARRAIPSINICRISCSSAEQVTRAECEADIVAPIRAFLASHPDPNRLDYIVLTKGIPLKAVYDYSYFAGAVSVSSLLTCVGEPAITYPPATPLDPYTAPPIVNPWGPTASPAAPEQYFTHSLSLGGRRLYAVTRLDAYSEADIRRMIDDSLVAQPLQGLFLLDGASPAAYPALNDRLRLANGGIIAKGRQTFYTAAEFDSRAREFVGGQQGLMGYFSWGSNETYSFTQAAYVSNRFAPGSIADTYVSFSGRTFTYPPSPGQSLIADLIPLGLSGGNGYVSEPNAYLATYPNVLFDRYLKGYNLAESFMAATPELYWKAATIGDPLMAPYATPPVVTFDNPNDGDTINGYLVVHATASDESGVRKVEFFIDDQLVAECSHEPFEFEWDAGTYSRGLHTLEAVAYEDTAVRTQGSAKIQVRLVELPGDVALIGDLTSVSDGQTVRLASKTVIAGRDAFEDCIYVCESDRSSGIKVIGPTVVSTGDLVDVIGETATVAGERCILSSSVARVGSSSVPAPIYLLNRDLGNGGGYLCSGPQAGVSNTGLLVRTCGQVQQLGSGWFEITDRSARLSDGLFRVSVAGTSGVQLPTLRSFVSVTGVSALEIVSGSVRPVLRVRSPGDVVRDLTFSQLVAPPGTVMPVWNLLSIPGMAVNPAAASVLPGTDLDLGLYSWNNSSQSNVAYDSGDPDSFPPLCPGVGVWFCVKQPYSLTTRVIAGQPDSDFWIGLPAQGYSLIGHPFTTPSKVRDCRITDGREVLTLRDAVTRGWLYQDIPYWRSADSSLASMDVIYDEDAEFEPWHGYWIVTYRPKLALIIPSPAR